MSNPIVIDTILFGSPVEVHLFGLIAFGFAALVHPTYLYSMVTGAMTPPRSSWFLWLLLDAVVFGSQWSKGVFDAMLLEYTIGTAVVALFTLRYGTNEWTRLETYCSIFVIGSIFAYFQLGPQAAAICSMTGITVAALPVLRRVFEGQYEAIIPWSLALTGSIMNVFDDKFLTGVWFAVLQALVVLPVLYHHFWKESTPASAPIATD